MLKLRPLILLAMLELLLPCFGHAQSTDQSSSDAYNLPEEKYTGTLDDEDEDNPAVKQRMEEDSAFGDEKSGKAKKTVNGDNEQNNDDIADDDIPTYTLKFNFDSQVVFTDKEGRPYMEVNYNTKVEESVALVNRRWRSKSDAQFQSEITGNLAGNDLFTCKLDITIDSFPVDLMTRLKYNPETDDEPENFEVAAQIKFQKSYKEDWFSNCTGLDGSMFNTQGNPEKYNMTILDDTQPSLNGIVIDNFDPGAGAQIEITSDPIEIQDEDMNEHVTLTGSGTLSIEPLR